FPTKERLDELFPDNPVMLTRIDGHAALVNSKAFEIAGIDAATKVNGGSVVLKNGEPTGVLIDNAIDLVSVKIPDPDVSQIAEALISAQKNCFAVGLTGVHDAGLGKNIIDMIDSLQQSGQLKMPMYVMLSPTRENFVAFVEKGPLKTEKLNIRSIKLYADGALGSRGAKLLEDYSDDPGNSGLVLQTPDSIWDICKTAYEKGFQVNTHAIGDSANRMMLQLYGEVLKGENDKRWRIEHVQIIAPEDFDLFSKYSIVPSSQPTHATSDMYWAEDRVGPKRIKGAYAYKKLLDQTGWIPLGTDFPIESINPLYTFYAAVVRKDLNGWPEDGFQMEDALSREEALKGMTIWAARAAFEENEKGSLEPGKSANFVVFEEDIMEIPEKDIPETKVLKTFIGGELVYSDYVGGLNKR
nr:amidohydrolase [Bacteroidota bacterium]